MLSDLLCLFEGKDAGDDSGESDEDGEVVQKGSLRQTLLQRELPARYKEIFNEEEEMGESARGRVSISMPHLHTLMSLTYL